MSIFYVTFILSFFNNSSILIRTGYLQLVKQVEVLNDRAVCADTDLRADMERWHKTKRKDFRQLFSCMADRQIQYYQKVMILKVIMLKNRL